MKRVVLTGVGGFIGAHCVKHFMENTDWQIVGVDSFRHKGTHQRLLDIAGEHIKDDRFELVTTDLSVPFSEQVKNLICDAKINKRGNVVRKKINYIINMASDSAVERSTVDPVGCFQNNSNLMLNMLEYAREARPDAFFQISTDEVYGEAKAGQAHSEWDVIMPSNPYAASKAAQEAAAIAWWRTYDVPVVITNCFDMKTRAFTPNGIKSYDELQEGDLVWTLDENENLVKQPIKKLIKMPSNGEMIYIKTNKVDQLVTPNHRVMYRQCTGKPRKWGNIEEVWAEKLFGMKGRIRIPTTGNWRGEDENELIETSDILDQNNLHHNAFRLPEKLNKVWLAQILGWFVSEGYTGSSIFFGAASEKQKGYIRPLLSAVGIKEQISTNKRAIGGSNKALQNLLEAECGHFHASHKRIPEWAMNWSTFYLNILWEAAMKGDGSRIKTNSGGTGVVYYTTSLRLAEQMMEIGMKLGMSVRLCDRMTWNPQKTKKSKSYIVRFRRQQADVEARNIKRVVYKGDVWCPQVPSGKLFVERNGKVFLSGQTMNNIGEGQDPEKFLPKIIKMVATGQEIGIYGDSLDSIGTRYYLHAANHADAIVFLSKQPVAAYSAGAFRPNRYNVCGNVEMSNLELAQLVAKLMGKELKWRLIPSDSARPGYDRRYALDSKLLTDLGWTPPISFQDSLERIIKWTLTRPHWVV